MNKKIKTQFILGIALWIISMVFLIILVVSIATGKDTMGNDIGYSVFYLIFACSSIALFIETGAVIGIKRLAEECIRRKGMFSLNGNAVYIKEHVLDIHIQTKGHEIVEVSLDKIS